MNWWIVYLVAALLITAGVFGAYALGQRHGKDEGFCEGLEHAREEARMPHGTYECFHCCSPHSVVWDSDFTFEDCGYEGEGIVHFCHCSECGAEIEYRIPCDDGEEVND